MDNQVSARTLANLLGVSKKTISQLARLGIIAPAEGGRYALEASVNSYCAYLRGKAGRGTAYHSAAEAKRGAARQRSPD